MNIINLNTAVVTTAIGLYWLTLAACSSTPNSSQSQLGELLASCGTDPAFDIGSRLGSDPGLSAVHATEFVEQCSAANPQFAKDTYLEGFTAAQQKRCTMQQGRRLGKDRFRYSGSCSGQYELPFLVGYIDALEEKQFELEKEIDSLDWDITGTVGEKVTQYIIFGLIDTLLGIDSDERDDALTEAESELAFTNRMLKQWRPVELRLRQ